MLIHSPLDLHWTTISFLFFLIIWSYARRPVFSILFLLLWTYPRVPALIHSPLNLRWTTSSFLFFLIIWSSLDGQFFNFVLTPLDLLSSASPKIFHHIYGLTLSCQATKAHSIQRAFFRLSSFFSISSLPLRMLFSTAISVFFHCPNPVVFSFFLPISSLFSSIFSSFLQNTNIMPLAIPMHGIIGLTNAICNYYTPSCFW